jgi:hypothetical protein
MLYTIVLPETDENFSAQALQAAIDDFGVILMLVFGTSAKARLAVEIADALCAGTDAPGVRMRRVVWVRDPNLPKLEAIVRPILGGKKKTWPLVAVLNFTDVLKATLGKQDVIDELELEIAFLSGYAL